MMLYLTCEISTLIFSLIKLWKLVFLTLGTDTTALSYLKVTLRKKQVYNLLFKRTCNFLLMAIYKTVLQILELIGTLSQQQIILKTK
jgi:hypothetical protein